MFLKRLGQFFRGLMASLVILAALLAIAYWALADRIDGVVAGQHPDATAVVVGRVADSQSVAASSEGMHAVYLLRDATGEIWVVSRNGAPQRDTWLIVWGRRQVTASGRPVLTESNRAGTF